MDKEKYKIKCWCNAREELKRQMMADPKPGGIRHTFLANVAMMLYDHYGLDHAKANEAADNVIKLVFEDAYY